MPQKIRIAVSACLLGKKVRYDGGHKYDSYIADTLGELFDFVPICPEAECGLPIPREPMRLEGDSSLPRLVVIETGVELTGKMLAWCDSKIDELRQAKVAGFILKARSPSCGVYDTPILDDAETIREGGGIFAQAVRRGFPGLPLEDEETIREAERLKRFLEQTERSAPG